MKHGFNVMEDEVVDEHGVPSCSEISIVEMFRKIANDELEKWDEYCVKGFSTLVAKIEQYDSLAAYLNELLDNNINELSRSANTFQIEINTDNGELENWDDKPHVKTASGNKHNLFKIFNHMEMQDNPNWYHSQLNINS